MSRYPSYWSKAVKILSKRDKVLKRLILKYNDKFFRTINEVPTFLLVVIVFLVVFKPSF